MKWSETAAVPKHPVNYYQYAESRGTLFLPNRSDTMRLLSIIIRFGTRPPEASDVFHTIVKTETT